jgi:hypothetical protein
MIETAPRKFTMHSPASAKISLIFFYTNQLTGSNFLWVDHPVSTFIF